jgi:hypothetical protein
MGVPGSSQVRGVLQASHYTTRAAALRLLGDATYQEIETTPSVPFVPGKSVPTPEAM